MIHSVTKWISQCLSLSLSLSVSSLLLELDLQSDSGSVEQVIDCVFECNGQESFSQCKCDSEFDWVCQCKCDSEFDWVSECVSVSVTLSLTESVTECVSVCMCSFFYLSLSAFVDKLEE